ncbi:protein kinase domain-containing protein [Virgisporangium aurantiacum]|nr:protein kinase [Virgisporangium aurantiacum]
MDDDPLARTPASQVLDHGSPQVGEVLAQRYRLEEHIGNDMLGRQLWRGSDVILQRPVTVVLRYPGGDSAAEMLSAAVTASRIVHPHLIGVYDAIDEGDRAYVVREWVEGTSLRKVVASYGPLEADKAVAIAHAVAAAVSALHDTGMAHGNVQPGTVLIGDDGRVVLGDARADEAATVESDIRAIGAVLYCALTGNWPHVEAGVANELDASRNAAGAILAPHQIRAGIPNQVDQLTVDLLNPNLDLPTAEVLANELSHLDNAEGALFADEPLDLDAFDSAALAPESSTPTGRKMAIVIAALLVIAIAGTIAAVNTLGGSKNSPTTPQVGAVGTAAPGKSPTTGTGAAAPITIAPTALRIVAPVNDRDNAQNASKMVDGNPGTTWRTNQYFDYPNFGNIKPGIGVLIDLGKETAVSAVQIDMAASGATVVLKGSNTAVPDSREGDAAAVGWADIGEPKVDATTRLLLSGQEQKVRYLLVWFTKIPPSPADGANKFRLEVMEIAVRGQQSP